HTWTERDNLWYLQPVTAFDDIMGFILVQYSLTDMKKKEEQSLLFYALIFAALILTMLILTNRLIRRIILLPVDRLILNMSHIEKGQYGTQTNPLSDDEIGELAKRFNAMSTEIDTSYRQIEKQNQQLHKTKNLLDGIINSMPSALITIDKQCRIKQWNAKASEISGFDISNASGQKLLDIFSFLSALMPQILDALEGKTSRRFPKVETSWNNSPRFFDIIVYPIVTEALEDTVIIIEDVTHRVHMEAMIVQSEKMMSVGGLAAGMAHEINNPLAGMVQNAQVIANRMTHDLPANINAAESLGVSMDTLRGYMEKRQIGKLLDAMKTSGDRAAQIVKNMLTFSRQSTEQLTGCSINQLLDATITLLENDYDLKKRFDFKEIDIHREYDLMVPDVECDENRLQQVLFNILKNGAEAMAEVTPRNLSPTFWIRTRSLADWVQIEIEDNGPGMSEDVQKRVFEPFFTTKEVGVGTGLGLSVSYFIITDNHKGNMWVESSPGAGTTFVIQIPVNPAAMT
ncbi:MAG: HAMP domain-containing protein, partial [Desulfobacteraceae bacterium]